MIKSKKLCKTKCLIRRVNKVKIDVKEPEFSDYYEEENDQVNDMSQQMYSDKYTRVQAAVRVRPFIETEVGFNEGISIPSPDTIKISDFTKEVEK